MGTDVDPSTNHAVPPTKQRYRAIPLTTSTPSSRPRFPPPHPTPSTHAKPKSTLKQTSPSTSRKRPARGSSTPNLRTAKRSKTNSVSHRTVEEDPGEGEDEDRSSPEPEPEIQNQVEPALQVCRYLLEMFSVPLLRSHATVSLIDRDRLQLYHANRSVILVSSAINFSEGDGKDKFIATIIAFHCLTLKQNGILETQVPKNAQLLTKSKFPEPQVVQRGNELHFVGKGSIRSFEVTLGDVISRDPAMVGRSTVVLKGTSVQWPDVPLVIKISWPTSTREPETNFLERAGAAATGKHEWAANHLPNVYYAEDVVFSADSTIESVAGLFANAKFADDKKFVYERRTLRIIIQELLYPLKSLASVKEIGQVFVDVTCGTCVLPLLDSRPLTVSSFSSSLALRICRDPSSRPQSQQHHVSHHRGENAEGERKVYGVLTDYDLSSWTSLMNSNYEKTSQQRTGTPPYMAHELLRNTSNIHLYRHDLESLFYIMLLMAARHTIGTPEGENGRRVITRKSKRLPFQDWFNEPRYHVLGSLKGSFLSELQPITLSPVFEDFLPWLEDLQQCFSSGFNSSLPIITGRRRFGGQLLTLPSLSLTTKPWGDISPMPPS
jgi:hypothetical protein